MSSKHKILQELPGLAGLGEAVIDRLCVVADVLTVQPGDRIVELGRRASHCYLIGSGTVEPSPGQRILSLQHLATQAAWQRIPATVTAKSEVTILIIDRRHASALAALIGQPVRAEKTGAHASEHRPVLVRPTLAR